jgi:hypothetical protein
MTKLTLHLWWESRDPWRDEDARKLARFVNGLPDFDPIYRSWLDSPDGQEQTVPVPLSEAAAKQLLIDSLEYYDVVRPDVPPAPWPELGCSFWGGHAGPPPYDRRLRSERLPPSEHDLHAAFRDPSFDRKTVARLGAEAADALRPRDLEPRGNVRHAFVL